MSEGGRRLLQAIADAEGPEGKRLLQAAADAGGVNPRDFSENPGAGFAILHRMIEETREGVNALVEHVEKLEDDVAILKKILVAREASK